MELQFLSHIELGMVVMFVLGIITVLMYSKVTPDTEGGVKGFFKLNAQNVVFHVVSSLMVFIAIGELGEAIIENWIPALKDRDGYYFTLSALVGMFGSWLAAWVIEIARKIFK